MNETSENITLLSEPISTSDALGSGWTNKQIILTIVIGIIDIVTILGNCLVLYVFATAKRKLRSPTHLLLANLAVADLLVGIIVMPLFASLTISNNFKWYFGKSMCYVWEYVHFSLCASSLLSMMGVTIERYIGVRYPLKHKLIMSRKRVIRMMIAIWIVAVTITATPLSIWPAENKGLPYACHMNLRTDLLLFVCISVYLLPVSITLLVYWRIYRYAARPFGPSDPQSSIPSEIKKYTEMKDLQFRLAKKIGSIVAVMFLIYGPLFFVFILKAVNSPLFTRKTLLFVGWLRYFSSCSNTFLYAFAVPGYKKELRDIISQQQCGVSTTEVDSSKQSKIKKKAESGEMVMPVAVEGLNDQHCTH